MAAYPTHLRETLMINLESQSPTDSDDLKLIWETFQTVNPKIRIRDAAYQLGVSEAELLATSCGQEVTRLQGAWVQFIKRLTELGPLMALTRNDNAVSEIQGTYRNIGFRGNIGIVRDLGGIDLRLFMTQWHAGFAVESRGHRGPLCSFQFFDNHGTAVHKIYLTENSDKKSYDRLVNEYASTNQETHQQITPTPSPAPECSDSTIDVVGLEAAWNSLQDTHDFNKLLQYFNVGRVQALRLVDDELAYRVRCSALNELLHMVAQYNTPIMVFVGNHGAIQIHSGPVFTIKATGSWINVLDNSFNLHVREDQIASAWIVRKPTVDGIVSSLELYDKYGETIALLYAKRKEGFRVLESWQSALSALLPETRPSK